MPTPESMTNIEDLDRFDPDAPGITEDAEEEYYRRLMAEMGETEDPDVAT